MQADLDFGRVAGLLPTNYKLEAELHSLETQGNQTEDDIDDAGAGVVTRSPNLG
jgi:hypothetical protein